SSGTTLTIALRAPGARDRPRAAAPAGSGDAPQADGIGRTGHGGEEQPAPDARRRPAEHRRRSDLAVAQHPEQLPEAGQPRLEERVDRFERAVARRDAGTAAHHDDAGAAAPPDRPEAGPQALRIVLHD